MNKLKDYKFGDIVRYAGKYAEANGTAPMVVVAIQPDNGPEGAVVVFEEISSPLSFVGQKT